MGFELILKESDKDELSKRIKGQKEFYTMNLNII